MNNTSAIPRKRSVCVSIAGFLIDLVVLVAYRAKKEVLTIGKWQLEGSNEAIEFRSDGTCNGVDEYGRVLTY